MHYTLSFSLHEAGCHADIGRKIRKWVTLDLVRTNLKSKRYVPNTADECLLRVYWKTRKIIEITRDSLGKCTDALKRINSRGVCGNNGYPRSGSTGELLPIEPGVEAGERILLKGVMLGVNIARRIHVLHKWLMRRVFGRLRGTMRHKVLLIPQM